MDTFRVDQGYSNFSSLTKDAPKEPLDFFLHYKNVSGMMTTEKGFRSPPLVPMGDGRGAFAYSSAHTTAKAA